MRRIVVLTLLTCICFSMSVKVRLAQESRENVEFNRTVIDLSSAFPILNASMINDTLPIVKALIANALRANASRANATLEFVSRRDSNTTVNVGLTFFATRKNALSSTAGVVNISRVNETRDVGETRPLIEPIIPEPSMPVETRINETRFSKNLTNFTSILIPPILPYGMTDEFWRLIPPNFWIDKNGSVGKDFIVLKTQDHKFFSCDENGKLYVNKTLSKNSLWMPKTVCCKQTDNHVTLQNYFGGYLNVNIFTKKVDCLPRVPTVSNYFKVLYSQTKDDDFNMLLMNEGFLTIGNDNIFKTYHKLLKDKSQFFMPIRKFSGYTNEDKHYWAGFEKVDVKDKEIR